MALKERRETVLRVIIEDYITRVVPVASSAVVKKYGLKVSPATIRNDTAYLEREGYVIHPHRSAGSVPTDNSAFGSPCSQPSGNNHSQSGSLPLQASRFGSLAGLHGFAGRSSV